MSFLSNAPSLASSRPASNNNSLSLGGAPSLTGTKNQHNTGTGATSLMDEILGGVSDQETSPTAKKEKKKKHRSKKHKSKSKDRSSRHRDGNSKKNSSNTEDPASSGTSSSSTSSTTGAAKAGEVAQRTSNSSGYFPGASTRTKRNNASNIASRALGSMGDLDSDLFGLGGNSGGSTNKTRQNNNHNNNNNTGAAAVTKNSPKSQTVDSFDDSWGDVSMDDLLMDGKPLETNTTASTRHSTTTAGGGYGNNGRNNIATKKDTTTALSTEEQLRRELGLGLEDSMDLGMDDSLGGGDGGGGGGYNPSWGGTRGGDDDDDDDDDKEYLERKKKREEEQQQAEAERKQRKRQQEQQQQQTQQQQKAQPDNQRNSQPELSRHRNNPSTLHTSTASSLVHTASFKAPSSSSSSSSSSSAAATSPTHSQLRQLTRTIDSMETTRASIARRTEHDKKALVAEYESKISLMGAERESEKRDMQLSMDRQQDTILRLKRSATDLQQQLTDKVAASQREREESLNNHRLSMERMTTLHATQIEAIQTNHANKFKSQEEIFSEKLDNGERKYKSMMDLNALTLQVNQCVSNVDSLTSTLATTASSSEQSRLASIEARESLVAEMEKSVRDTKKRSDAEYSRLQSMLATLEITQERLTSSTNEDRIRLREEHARLEAAQVALETERTVVRNGLSKERDDLRQERHQFEMEKREWREKHEHELKMLEDGNNNLKLLEVELDEKKLQLKRSESNIGLMKNELAQKRTMMMEEMEQEMVRNRQERTELERFKLELNMEKTSLGVDQKNMKVDMDRLTNLGLELRKQSQSLSEAQHTVVQERMKNEMLKNDIKEYHQDLQSNRSSMDDATMQLHMAKKRHANAAMSMKLTRKSYTSKENKNNGGSGGGGGAGEHVQPSWTTKPIKYPAYSATGTGSGGGGTSAPTDLLKPPSVILNELSQQRSNTAIQSELKRIEDEFTKRAMRSSRN